MTHKTESTNNSIDMKKQYRTRSGLPVRVLCTDRNDLFSVVVLVSVPTDGDYVVVYPPTGKAGGDPSYDLIEVLPFEDFNVDDLCVVWGADGIKHFRYFSHAKHGVMPVCFDAGTSYTAKDTYMWSHCRKAAPEEIATKTINQDL